MLADPMSTNSPLARGKEGPKSFQQAIKPVKDQNRREDEKNNAEREEFGHFEQGGKAIAEGGELRAKHEDESGDKNDRRDRDGDRPHPQAEPSQQGSEVAPPSRRGDFSDADDEEAAGEYENLEEKPQTRKKQDQDPGCDGCKPKQDRQPPRSAALTPLLHVQHLKNPAELSTLLRVVRPKHGQPNGSLSWLGPERSLERAVAWAVPPRSSRPPRRA